MFRNYRANSRSKSFQSFGVRQPNSSSVTAESCPVVLNRSLCATRFIDNAQVWKCMTAGSFALQLEEVMMRKILEITS